jgi:16S rRNA (guanine527-N7)-methyltransferase
MENVQLATVLGYFPELRGGRQEEQLAALEGLYAEWNAQINVISRKDIGNLYLHHVLHSLGITKMLKFRDGTSVMDLGTGGGFPGIPLAIYFPQVHFHLVDSVGKKIKVAQAVAGSLGLENVTVSHNRVEDEKGTFDFVVSRAVMPLADLAKIAAPKVRKQQKNALPNGLLCLKGGEPGEEAPAFKAKLTSIELETYFKETYYRFKKVVYIPL